MRVKLGVAAGIAVVSANQFLACLSCAELGTAQPQLVFFFHGYFMKKAMCTLLKTRLSVLKADVKD